MFATLADQHAQAAQMFEQIQSHPLRRAVLWPELRRLLVSHEHAEVRELYPVLRQYGQTFALANDHDAEACQLDALIGRLDTLPIDSAPWGAVFDQLVVTVLHHAKEVEEQQIFPVAQQVLGEARALELDAKLAMAQQPLALAN
ncbi:MAG TPA: hemerythrin domain-containing protein [Kofleriaceae bacterium]